MFLQENQYQLARKLNRKKFLGRKRDERGRVVHSLSTIWLKYGAGRSKLISGNSHKTFNLGWNCDLFLASLIESSGTMCGTISFWCHALAFLENVDKSVAMRILGIPFVFLSPK